MKTSDFLFLRDANNKRPFKTQFFLYWLKLDFVSFGGPAGQISIMHQELVEKRLWISEYCFLHALNYTMVLPFLFILSALTWIYLTYGTLDEVTAIVLFAAYRVSFKVLSNKYPKSAYIVSAFPL